MVRITGFHPVEKSSILLWAIMEEWFKCWCKCKAVNWVYAGDPMDQTIPDVHGFICFKCGESNEFDGLDLFEDEGRYFKEGLEQP